MERAANVLPRRHSPSFCAFAWRCRTQALIMPPVRTVAIINQKGGVGKTTTVANLGAAVATRGMDVCLLDLDPQAHLTLHYGLDATEGTKTSYDVITDGCKVSEATELLTGNLWLLPATIDLAGAETELAARPGRERLLRNSLTAQQLPHDFVLIDCPPSLGLLTINALAAANDVIIPLQPHFLALQGLGKLLETISLVCEHINPSLRVTGVLLCMYESVTRLTAEVVDDLRAFFDTQRHTDKPWAHARIFQTVVRRNIKLAECPSYGKTIFEYEPRSHGAADYNALADEFLSCFAPDRPAEASELHRPAPHTQPAEPGDTQPQ